ncbi:MAG: ribonuclease H family protein, partial [Cyanobacteria bacterium J06553_1]
PASGRTAAAYVTQGGSVAWRTSDHCSSLQTELAGILGALTHARTRNEDNIIVHTDSRSALMVLQQPRQKDNIRLSTTILGLARSLRAAGKRVVLNWVPSHVGIRGNSSADEAARQATARPEVDLVVRPSLRYTKDQARCATWSLAHRQQRRAQDSFQSAAWYSKLSGGTPLKTSRQCGRRNAVLLHRLRLGYRTYHERVQPEVPRQCEHCGFMASLPLQHYLLECPSTNRLRMTVAGLTTGSPEDKAANIVRNICESQHPEPLFDILHRYPPPR